MLFYCKVIISYSYLLSALCYIFDEIDDGIDDRDDTEEDDDKEDDDLGFFLFYI